MTSKIYDKVVKNDYCQMITIHKFVKQMLIIRLRRQKYIQYQQSISAKAACTTI